MTTAAHVNGHAHKRVRSVQAIEVPDPFEGLEHLRASAITGHDALVAATAKPIAWVWSGILASYHVAELSGPSGVGKTTLAFLLVAAIANPTSKPIALLGREVTPAAVGRFVVVIEEENGTHSTRAKIETACSILELPVRETVDRIVFIVRRNVQAHPTRAGAERETVWSDVVELGRRRRIAAVVVDSRARVLRGGESSKEEDQAKIAAVVFDLVEASSAPVIVISHTRKSGASTIEDVAGSNQRAAAADVVILVSGERNDAGQVTASRVVFAKLRDAPDDHPQPVTYSIAKDDRGRWRIAVDASAKSEDLPAHERVFELLAGDGPKTKNAIREALSMSGAAVEKCITVLFAEKRITKRKKAHKGRAVDVFEVRAERRMLPSFAELMSDEPAGSEEDDHARQ